MNIKHTLNLEQYVWCLRITYLWLNPKRKNKEPLVYVAKTNSKHTTQNVTKPSSCNAKTNLKHIA